WFKRSAPTIPTLSFGSSRSGDVPGACIVAKRSFTIGCGRDSKVSILSHHFAFCACRLIYRFSYIVRLGKTLRIHPAQCVTNLKPCKANRQPHQVLRASTSEHSHVPARFQHSHTLFPHCW